MPTAGSRPAASADAAPRASIADVLHDQLRAAILSGRQPPGSLLAGEVELAANAGVNRQPVREALQRLRQVGLVDIVQGGGARVLDWRTTGTLSVLGEALVASGESLDPAILASVFRLRMVTLTDAARLAAEHRPDGLLDALEALLARMRSEFDQAAALRSAFWGEIATGSRNLAYRLVFNTQLAVAARLPPAFIAGLLQGAAIVETYAALAAAIGAGDIEAAGTHAQRILAPAVDHFTTLAGG